MELNGTAANVKYNRFHIEHHPQYVPDPFRSENFYYNKKEDYCVCPMGQHMTRTDSIDVRFRVVHHLVRRRARTHF